MDLFFQNKKTDFKIYVKKGALAGACAKTVIAPADRIKILYQVNPE